MREEITLACHIKPSLLRKCELREVRTWRMEHGWSGVGGGSSTALTHTRKDEETSVVQKLMSAGLYLLRPRVTSHTTCLPAIFSQVRLIVCWQEIASTSMKQSGKRLSLQPDYCYRSLCTSGDGRALNPIVVRVWLSNGGKEAAYKHSADFCQGIPVKYT